MTIKVRFGNKDDIDALVEVECSGVEIWYHYSSKGRGNPASYDELSPWEKFMHGGPWMDATTLTKYWDRIERLGIIPLVAEFDGKIVGHLDVIFSEDPALGRFLYLDVLTVHKAYRRRGVASILIKEAEKLAIERKAEFMLVQPEEYEGPSGLTYRNCGFKKAFDVYSLEIATKNSPIPSNIQLMPIPQIQNTPPKTHAMICGWYNISAKMWDYGVNPNIELLHNFSCHQLSISVLTDKDIHFFHFKQNYFDHAAGTLCLWAPTPLNERTLRHIIQVASTTASWLGIKTLVTSSIEKYTALLQRLGFALKSKEEPFMIKKLNDF